jgi:hypothetical protein
MKIKRFSIEFLSPLFSESQLQLIQGPLTNSLVFLPALKILQVNERGRRQNGGKAAAVDAK